MKNVQVNAPPRELTLHTIRAFLADYADENPNSTIDQRLDVAAEWLDQAIKFGGPLAPLELIDGPAIRWVLELVALDLWPRLVRAWREARSQATPEEKAARKSARKAAQAERHAERTLASGRKQRKPSKAEDDGRGMALGFVESGGPIDPAVTLLDAGE